MPALCRAPEPMIGATSSEIIPHTHWGLQRAYNHVRIGQGIEDVRYAAAEGAVAGLEKRSRAYQLIVMSKNTNIVSDTSQKSPYSRILNRVDTRLLQYVGQERRDAVTRCSPRHHPRAAQK